MDFDAESSGSGFRGRPSFRDLVAFTFQPQNIVANQNVLFFKADTHEHREKLRTIFPYVLGAVSPAILAKQHELSELRRELGRKERELASLREVSERWIAEIRAWASQARELGLLRNTLDIDSPVTSLIDELRTVASATLPNPSARSDSVRRSVAELVALQREESDRVTAVAQARSRLSEMERLRDTTTQYEGQLHVQRDRLKVAEWLGDLHAAHHACPVCGQAMVDSEGSLEPLLQALREIERSAGELAGIPAAFDRELQRVTTELRTATEQLEGVRHRVRALSRASEAAKAQQDATLESSRFVGRLEQALQHYEMLGDDSSVVGEVFALRERVEALEAELRQEDTNGRTERALRTVALHAQRILPTLDAERPYDPISLSVTELTIRVAGREREDYLWEIGSGSNWLAYHLSTLIGLQQFFLELRYSPVPSFLVIDQPSQVYFPKFLTPAQEEGAVQPYRDEDVEAVRSVFASLAKAVEEANGRLQIIVLDHATDTVWGGVHPLVLAADWRGGAKLVPEHWPARVS